MGLTVSNHGWVFLVTKPLPEAIPEPPRATSLEQKMLQEFLRDSGALCQELGTDINIYIYYYFTITYVEVN